MAGILDKKTRFMDTILTDRGRKELAKGELNFAFATFSDLGTFYESSVENPNIAEEAVSRIMLEAFSRYRSLSEMYDTFIDKLKSYKKGLKALQSILLSGNGLSETETRMLVDERNTTVWAKFVFQIEPHLICRRGSFLHLANIDVCRFSYVQKNLCSIHLPSNTNIS